MLQPVVAQGGSFPSMKPMASAQQGHARGVSHPQRGRPSATTHLSKLSGQVLRQEPSWSQQEARPSARHASRPRRRPARRPGVRAVTSGECGSNSGTRSTERTALLPPPCAWRGRPEGTALPACTTVLSIHSSVPVRTEGLLFSNREPGILESRERQARQLF